MSKILIDARLYGLKHAGIGRYIQNLISEISRLDKTNHYLLLTSTSDLAGPLPKNCQIIPTNIRHYSLAEQIKLPGIISKLHPDLVHFPHFNAPLNYNCKFVVTIHDLLWHEKIGFAATTLPPIKYVFKYLGYRIVVRHAVSNASVIITPTEQVKTALIRTFKLPTDKISVTHEAADQIYFTTPKDRLSLASLGLTKPFLVYTGSLYPHKNVENLVLAIKKLPDIHLAIVSARNIFSQKFRRFIRQQQMGNRVHFLGFSPDHKLLALYKQAAALVLPSLSEGFGLTGLEAMAAGVPVICSQHSVLKEIYGPAAMYLDTVNVDKFSQGISDLLADEKTKQQLITAGKLQAAQYSWSKLATQTLAIYQSILRQN